MTIKYRNTCCGFSGVDQFDLVEMIGGNDLECGWCGERDPSCEEFESDEEGDEE